MLATWSLAAAMRLVSVTEAASKGRRRSSPTPGTRAACSPASRMLSISLLAVRAVSRAGMASTAIIWLTKIPMPPQTTVHTSTKRSPMI